MSWRIRCLVTSLGFFFTLPVFAQPKAHSSVFISEVELITSWGNDPSIERSLIETFKELLRLHGYETNQCQENAEAWQKRAQQDSTPNTTDAWRTIDQRLVAAQKCAVPPEASHSYDVKLILDYDTLLKNRRAVIHLISLDDPKAGLDGGYAHKPGEPAGWYDLMNRAIERTIRRFNENTAIRVSAPKEATVGQAVRVDGRTSWDPDGDAFELRWRVTVKACVGGGKMLPRDGGACPEGMKLDDAFVQDQAAGHDLTREFRVSLIGDYTIDVHAKIGAREEAVRSYRLRVFPRNDWTFFARIGALRLPKLFLSDSLDNEVGIVLGFGLLRRFLHRIGLFGWFEEVHYGLSVNFMEQGSTFNWDGRAVSALFTFDIVGRLLDRTGHYGMTSSSSMSVAAINALRRGVDHDEFGWMITAMVGAYYTFGHNYVNETTSLCTSVCPSLTLGPTFTGMSNSSAHRVGLTFGVETIFGLEF